MLDLIIVLGQLLFIAWLAVCAIIAVIIVPLILAALFIEKMLSMFRTNSVDEILEEELGPKEFMVDVRTPEDFEMFVEREREASQDLKDYFEHEYTGDLDRDANIIPFQPKHREMTYPFNMKGLERL